VTAAAIAAAAVALNFLCKIKQVEVNYLADYVVAFVLLFFNL